MFLRGLIRSLKRRWGTALATAAAVLLAAALLWPAPPLAYRAEARVLLAGDAPGADAFALSDPVLEKALPDSGSARLDRLRSSLEVVRPKGSPLLAVRATAALPSRASASAAAVARSFQALWNDRCRGEAARLEREIGERTAARAEIEKALAAAEASPAADPREEVRRARSAALLQAEGLAARMDLLSRRLEKGETGPARPLDTAASDRAAADLETARRRLEELRATYPDDWPPVGRAAADVERLRAAHAAALNRETLEARFAPVRSAVEELRSLARRRDEALLAAAQHEAVLAGSAPVPAAAARPDLRRRLDEATAALRGLSARRDLGPAPVERVDAPSEAALVSAPLPGILAAGLIAGILAACLREALATTLRTEQDLRRTVNLPLLAVAPRDGPAGEAWSTLAALIEGSAPRGQGRAYGIASAAPGEGKSTVAAALADALARAGSRTLLVDADLRRPAQHARFGVANETGLSTYLAGGTDTVDAAIVPTGVQNLSLLPSGPPPESPVPYLRSERFRAMAADLKGRFDFVILDLPPVGRAPDALLAAPLADGMILVIAAGESRKDEVTRAKRLVRSVGGTWTGCVLNKAAGEPLGYYRYGPSAAEA